MEFRFDDDQLAMRDAVRAFCADHLDLTHVAEREGKRTDPAAWRALADLGVLGMLAGDANAGLGLVEASIVFEELGAHLASGPVLWSTLAAPLIDGVADGTLRVAGVDVAEMDVANGEPAGTGLAHGEPAGTGSADRELAATEPANGEPGASGLADRELAATAVGPIVIDHGDESDVVLVLHGDRVVRCDRTDLPPALDGSPLDPLTPVLVVEAIPDGEVIGGPDEAATLRRSGTVLSAAMLVGVAQGALDVARDYALERHQFDRPIGSFQAIKHLLADMYVRLELARASTYAAAAIGDGLGPGDADPAARAAKLLAGDAGMRNSRSAVQILGGMGFTWDMLPHYYLKRTWVLEESFGTSAEHAARLGSAVGEEVVQA